MPELPRSVLAIMMHALSCSASTLQVDGPSSSWSSRRRTSVGRHMRRMTPLNLNLFLLGSGHCEHHQHPLTSLDPHHPPPHPLISLRSPLPSMAQLPMTTMASTSRQKRSKITCLLTGQGLRNVRNTLRKRESYVWRRCDKCSASFLGAHLNGTSVPRNVPTARTRPLTMSFKGCELTPIIDQQCFGI